MTTAEMLATIQRQAKEIEIQRGLIRRLVNAANGRRPEDNGNGVSRPQHEGARESEE